MDYINIWDRYMEFIFLYTAFNIWVLLFILYIAFFIWGVIKYITGRGCGTWRFYPHAGSGFGCPVENKLQCRLSCACQNAQNRTCKKLPRLCVTSRCYMLIFRAFPASFRRCAALRFRRRFHVLQYLRFQSSPFAHRLIRIRLC